MFGITFETLYIFVLLPLPAVVAIYRKVDHVIAIVLLSLTGFLWPIAMFWAAKGSPKSLLLRS